MRLILAAAVASLALAPSLALAGDPSGLWKTQPNDEGSYLHVRVAPCGGKICGTIETAHTKNGESRSDYPHLGRQMITGMEPDGDNAWDGGEIWAPDEDKTYSSNMELNGNTLRVEGCVLFICRGQDWAKVGG